MSHAGQVGILCMALHKWVSGVCHSSWVCMASSPTLRELGGHTMSVKMIRWLCHVRVAPGLHHCPVRERCMMAKSDVMNGVSEDVLQ
jgi:hypothetical protein